MQSSKVPFQWKSPDNQTWVWNCRYFLNHPVFSFVNLKWIDQFHLPKHRNPFPQSSEKTWIDND